MGKRYNPPPNWPTPPPGWEPPRGWTPDPSWPPAPPGWNFWTSEQRSSKPLPVTPFAQDVRQRVRGVAVNTRRVLSTERIVCAAITLVGATLLVWNFFDIRLDPQWKYGGWGCRGWLSLGLMLAGLPLTLGGAAGLRQSPGSAVRTTEVRNSGH